MKAKDVRELSLKELQTKEVDLQQEMFNLKFQFQTGQLEHAAKIKDLRKDLARVKTILQEKIKPQEGVSV